MPGAGKSSLLGALAQASQTQEHLLHGRLTDLSGGGLTELQHRVYDESPRRTVEEIIPYPIKYEPFGPTGPEGKKRPLTSIFIDCDGRVANDLLVRRKALEPNSPEGTLAFEILQADGLVLVIDISAPPTETDADFAEFGRFLNQLEHSRGERAEVGGLPVFLVLAKCDLLAQPQDSALDWMERIEERKRQVNTRFRDFLARREKGAVPFGRIDLHLWATAVKRPELANTPARPREPYGVAELFFQALQAASSFEKQQRRSRRRLAWTVTGAASLIVGLLTIAGVVANRSSSAGSVVDLQNKIEDYRSREGSTPSLRLPGSLEKLDRSIAVLTELQNDTGYNQLPLDHQDYVNNRLQELRAYEAYLRQILAARPPAAARNLNDLQAMEEDLKTTLAVPRTDWRQTEAARLGDERLADLLALRKGVDEANAWYQQLLEKGEELANFARRQPGTNGASLDWRSWQTDVKKLLAQAQVPPFRPNDRLRGLYSPTWSETVLRFDSVEEARTRWEQTRQRLDRFLNLSGALGLGLLPEKPPLLVFQNQDTATATDCRLRLEELRKAYPRFQEDFRPAALPEAAAADFRQAAQANYANLLEPGRAAVLRRLAKAVPGNRETAAGWQEVQHWLQKNPEELVEWRVLAGLLHRLAEPGVEEPDPVSELAFFLSRDRFEIALGSLSLKVPRDLGVRPQDNLSVIHKTASGENTLSLERVGEPEYDPQTRLNTYTFRLLQRATLTYHPGEDLWAQWPLRKEGETGARTLSWVRGRSTMFQFEHLQRGAFLHSADQAPATGTYYENLRPLSGPQTQIPRVPDLLPVVKLP
jgi:hypothetical protein